MHISLIFGLRQLKVKQRKVLVAKKSLHFL